jgi:hypothetical protein
MHFKEDKVNQHPMNNLVDIFPDMVVRSLRGASSGSREHAYVT